MTIQRSVGRSFRRRPLLYLLERVSIPRSRKFKYRSACSVPYLSAFQRQMPSRASNAKGARTTINFFVDRATLAAFLLGRQLIVRESSTNLDLPVQLLHQFL